MLKLFIVNANTMKPIMVGYRGIISSMAAGWKRKAREAFCRTWSAQPVLWLIS